MKKVLIAITAIMAGFIVFSVNIQKGHGNQNAAPAANTGSPGDNNKTCAQSSCHTGSSVIASPDLITSNIPGTGYVAGQTYTITATIADPNKVKFGFQVSPQNAAGTKLGTLVLTNTTTTTLIGASKYVTHKLAGTGGQGSRTWSFDWVAPASGSGPVTFYGAFNASNNNSSDSGDQIYTSTLTVDENTTGVNEMDADKPEVLVFPNPSNGAFKVAVSGAKSAITTNVFNTEGRLVYSNVYQANAAGKQVMDINADGKLSTGLYFVSVQAQGINKIVKMVVQ